MPAGGSLDATIATLQEHLRANPSDWRGLASLGLAYIQQARVTADPSYYPKAEGVLRRSLQIDRTENLDALVGMGALAAARHDFAGALRWGLQAKALNPYNASVYGVIGDAEIELGRYHQAFATFQTMVDTRPDVSSYARVSYARELMGDVPGAIEAMKGAQAFAGSSADAAWAAYQVGGSLLQQRRSRRRGEGLPPGRRARPRLRPAPRRTREGGVGARRPQGRDRRVHLGHGSLPLARIRHGARRSLRRERPIRPRRSSSGSSSASNAGSSRRTV